MLHTLENLRRLLDLLVVRPRLGPAMLAIGGSEKLIFDWLRRSAGGDEKFVLDWPEGSEPKAFHTLVAEARKKSVVVFEAAMRSEVLNGIPRVVLDGGKVQYEMDPRYIDWSDSDFRNLGFDPSERYLRDENGKLVPLVVYDPAPAHLKIHMLKSLMPGTYGERKTVDMNQRVSGGVMVVGRPPAIELTPTKIRDGLDDAADPTADQPDDSDLVRDLRRRLRERSAAPAPLAPAIAEPPKAALPSPRRGHHEGIGRGPDPELLNGTRGFKVS